MYTECSSATCGTINQKKWRKIPEVLNLQHLQEFDGGSSQKVSDWQTKNGIGICT